MRSFLASLLLFAAVLPARAETLNLLIWEDYIDPAILGEWTDRTGIAVNQIYFDSGDERDEILANPENDVDLVVVNENAARYFGNTGALEAVDAERLPAAAQYEPHWLDRCAGRGLPYFWGTMGILYRTDKVQQAPTSWYDLMDPAPALSGHVAMFDDYNETFVAPLAMLGQSINSNDDAVLKQAFAALKKQAPSVLTYDYVMTSSQDPAIGGEIYLALGYSGDQHAMNARPANRGTWGYVVPKEGSLFWLDCMSVTAGSKLKAPALDLLNHIAGRESAYRNAMTLNMPTANREALALVPAALREDPSVYPPPELIALCQTQQELTAEAVQRRRRIINALANFHDTR